jgi:hypothetical protein
MSWIADAGIASIALWIAVILTGIFAGTFAIRWNESRPIDRLSETLIFGAAAAGVVALFAHAGALLGGGRDALYTANVPIPVNAGFRLAVLWATLPGAALGLAVILLVRAALAGSLRSERSTRATGALSFMALLALGVAAWFTPAPNDVATRIPAFVQSTSAALAPLAALLSLAILLDTAAGRIGGKAPVHAMLLTAWVLATIGLTAEQMARSGLGVGPRDALIFGSASSGLVLWLVTSALLHGRVRAAVLRMNGLAYGRGSRTPGAVAAHIGAVLLAISFAAHAVAQRTTISLPAGETVDLTSFRQTWKLTNQGVSRFDEIATDVVSLALEVTTPSGKTSLLTPEVRDYHTPSGRHLDNRISWRESAGKVTQTMRVLLVGADSLDTARVRVTFLPLPILWPAGVILILLSVLALRRPAQSDLSADE